MADVDSPVSRPNARQLAWQDLELGLVYHYDLDVYMPGGHHHERSRREVLDPALYNPEELDTDQWLSAARAMGARYAVLTATHHQGFLQWPSDLYPFGVRQSPWRDGHGDLVGDFVSSCVRYGIRPGVYIGIRFNAYCRVYGYTVEGSEGWDSPAQAEYRRLCERLVEELCTRYGPWCEVWFDGGVLAPTDGGPDLLPIVRRHQPQAVYYHSPECAEHRWAGSETGRTDYPCWATLPSVESQYAAHRASEADRFRLLREGDPDGAVWCPAMCDAPIRDHDWLWRPEREARLFSPEQLLDMYVGSVGRNCNLILGAVPDRRGLIPAADVAVYDAFGRLLRERFGTPLAVTGPAPGPVLLLAFGTACRVHDICIQEDIRFGERVRRYVVEGLAPDAGWQHLAEGTCIGHKRIQPIAPSTLTSVRVRVLDSKGPVYFRRLAVYGNG